MMTRRRSVPRLLHFTATGKEKTLSEPDHEVTTGSRRAFDGRMLHVRVDDVTLPSGRTSVREVIEHPGSVIIVPLTSDDDVLMIRQFRHVTGKILLGLPAGLIDPGEEVLETARRELREETGHEAESLRLLTTVFASPGYTEERSSIVLAEGCRPVDQEPDQDEPIELARYAVGELSTLLVPGNTELEDAHAMLGLLWLLRLRGM